MEKAGRLLTAEENAEIVENPLPGSMRLLRNMA